MSSERHEWGLALVIAVVLLAIYSVSPQRRFYDSKYALLTSQAILERGDPDLLPFLPGLAAAAVDSTAADAEDGEPDEVAEPAPSRRRLPYQVKASHGRLLYLYSPGTALFSVPPVALLRLFGKSATGTDGLYDGDRERELQGLLAAWITAATAVLVFWAARRELPAGRAAAVALIAGLGSGLWSAASRAMWTHTWTALLVAAAWLELLRWEDGARRRGLFLGALLAALFWVRPTGAIVAAGVAIYVLVRHRPALPRLLAAGALGLAAYLVTSWVYWGALYPTYFRVGRRLFYERPWALFVFFELLISPGHGLFVFSPIVLLAGFWLVRHRVAATRRALAALAAGLFLGYVVLYSRWGWGGTVGPRFLCDPVPLLAWLGAHGWRRHLELRPEVRSRARRFGHGALASALIAASLVAHGVVAWDVRVPGRSRSPGPATELPAEVPYLEKPFWNWRTLPQLELPAVLDALERRRGRARADTGLRSRSFAAQPIPTYPEASL